MIKLELCESIYSYKNIEKVISIYHDYADIDYTKNQEKIILTFNNCKYDEKTTTCEFENYLIGLENT